MNQSINTDSKNSKEPQQKYPLRTVSIKILGGLNRFYRRLTSPSASIMAQNIQLFGPRGGFLTHQWIKGLLVFCINLFYCMKVLQAIQAMGLGLLVCSRYRTGVYIYCCCFFSSRLSYLPFLMPHLLGDCWTF